MKKILFLSVALVMALSATVQAQRPGGGGFQRLTPEENVKKLLEKLVDLKLDADQTKKTESALTDYFKSRDTLFTEMRSGNADRGQTREKFQQLNTVRDEKLKTIFSEPQYKKWKEEIEPALAPRRREGQGGDNRN